MSCAGSTGTDGRSLFRGSLDGGCADMKRPEIVISLFVDRSRKQTQSCHGNKSKPLKAFQVRPQSERTSGLYLPGTTPAVFNQQGNALMSGLRPAQTTRERKKVNLVHGSQSFVTKLSESDVDVSIGFTTPPRRWAQKLSCVRKIINFGLDIVRFPSYLRLTINIDYSRKVFTRKKKLPPDQKIVCESSSCFIPSARSLLREVKPG